MTDEPDLEPIDVTAELPPAAGTSALGVATTVAGAQSWPAGWYADPWTAGQYRLWDGGAWTGETHRSGPTATYPAPGASTTVTSAWPSAPATASSVATRASSTPGAGPPPGSVAGPRSSGAGAGDTERRRIVAIVSGVVVLALIAGAIGFAIENHYESKPSAANTTPTIPSGTTPTPTPSTSAPAGGTGASGAGGAGAGAAPSASDRLALSSMIVQQTDVGKTAQVVLLQNGNRTTQPTLDLCNGTFSSEKLRVARLQVEEVNAAGNGVLSTEAVVYRNQAATELAFSQLRSVTAKCPHKVVTSPVGEGQAETVFNAPPDASWPQVPSVERLAYSFVTTAQGQKSTSIAVYLRRGRLLLGIYFPTPSGAQPAVAGHTTIEGIVNLFAKRVAALPASLANG